MLPLAISYGMTSKEFWEDEPRLYDAYRISFEEKQKAQDEYAWLIGYYVYVGVNVNLYNMFKKSGEPTREYLKQPLSFPKEDEQKQQSAIIEERENKIKARLNKSKKILEEGKQDKGKGIRVASSN